MKRQRCRSEEYRARRWKNKAKRRQRRDPDGSRGVFTQEDLMAVRAAEAAEHTEKGRDLPTARFSELQMPDGRVLA